MKKFFALLLILLSFTGFSQATVYKTAGDYGKEADNSYKEVVMVKHNLILSHADGSVTVYNLKKENVWGFRNNFGEEYRIRKGKQALRIVEYGPISIYTSQTETATTSRPDIDAAGLDNPYDLTKLHSFSIGPNGPLIKFSNNRFLKALKEKPKAYQHFVKLIDSNTKELLLKVIEYNASVN